MGFEFVEYKTSGDANTAIKHAQLQLDGHQLELKQDGHKDSEQQSDTKDSQKLQETSKLLVRNVQAVKKSIARKCLALLVN